MRFQDDESFELIICGTCSGTSYVPAENLDLTGTAWFKHFLPAFQNIQLNKEIPILLNVNSKDCIYAHDLSDFFTPERFDHEEYVFVRVLTISFSDVVDPEIEQTKASPPQ